MNKYMKKKEVDVVNLLVKFQPFTPTTKCAVEEVEEKIRDEFYRLWR